MLAAALASGMRHCGRKQIFAPEMLTLNKREEFEEPAQGTLRFPRKADSLVTLDGIKIAREPCTNQALSQIEAHLPALPPQQAEQAKLGRLKKAAQVDFATEFSAIREAPGRWPPL